jgi:hypothetical protein
MTMREFQADVMCSNLDEVERFRQGALETYGERVAHGLNLLLITFRSSITIHDDYHQ